MLKLLFATTIIFFLFSCKNVSKNSELSNNNIVADAKSQPQSYDRLERSKYSKEDFDFILKDREDSNWHPKGLLVLKITYLPNYNDIGNVLFYFFSKSGTLKWQKKMDSSSEEETDKELERIKNLALEEFKKEFEIYTFVIDKKYIQDTPEGPYQKDVFVKELYHHNTNTDIWVKIDSFEVKTEEDFIKEREWSKDILSKIVK